MIQTVKQACKFNPIIKDYRMSQAIENLQDLIEDQGDGREFFSRNYVTNGMEQLFREGLLRLSGKSDQAVFELTQAMGGGKTHMMIALGLLAKHPHLRSTVLDDSLNSRIDFGEARIAAFNGRNNPENYIWGAIAEQLGKPEEIKSYWVNGPKAVDQAKWKVLIGDEPTLILLDELPPYLVNAATQTYGTGTLADMVVYSLSSLMTAALELPNCVIVIANLSGSYGRQTRALQEAVSNLQQETRRQSMTITPVQLSGNEIYEILKKRLIDKLPGEQTIAAVADEYAQQIKRAEDAGYIISASIDHFAEQVRETYPFHPSFKHLVALFKENEGFRQTRGLMQFTARLLKSVEDRDSDDVYLIGAQHLALNDSQVRDEVERIAPNLLPAITRDIADNGDAIAELIDVELTTDASQQVMTLLLASSLSRAVGGRIGLSESEIVEFLAAPNRKFDEFLQAVQRLRQQAWYLHREDERYFVKETENLSRQIERNAREIPQPKVDQALINHLTGFLQPISRIAYQQVEVLPKLEDLNLKGPRTLIVVKPDGKLPPHELQNFFDYQQEKNNLLVLSGEHSHLAEAVEERLREFYAIEQIMKRLKPGDTLYEEAQERLEEAENRFQQALSAGYNRLYIPAHNDMDNRDELLPITIDNGLKLGDKEQSAETQIEALLSSSRADYKLATDALSDPEQYFAQAEAYLWPAGTDNRRAPWRDVLARARSFPIWPWMPGNSGLEQLKTLALEQGRWRLGADGYIEKGPFPRDKTTINITTLSADEEGSVLSLTPRHAGDSPLIKVAETKEALTNAETIDSTDSYTTKAGTLYFVVEDPTGAYETGEPVRWLADIKIQHQVTPAGDKRRVTLKAIPEALMRYTLDGSNPKEGIEYTEPFEIGTTALRLLVYAEAGEANKSADFSIPASGDNTVRIIDTKPATLHRRVVLDGVDKAYGVINKFREDESTLFKGVRIEIGEGEKTVTVRLQERAVSAGSIEQIIQSLRKALNEEQATVVVHLTEGSFNTGFDAKEFARIAEIQIKAGDVIQES